MEKILISVLGIGFIGAIYWFFFGKKEKVMEAKSSWDILVDGGYKPSVITLKAGQKSTLTFTRKDPNTCLEDFIIEDFKIKQYLPLNKPVSVTITPPSKGAFGFHCGMNMFHGRIEIV